MILVISYKTYLLQFQNGNLKNRFFDNVLRHPVEIGKSLQHLNRFFVDYALSAPGFMIVFVSPLTDLTQ